MEDNTSTIPNVYRYDSPAIYSSEQLDTIKELIGLIENHQDDERQLSYEEKSIIRNIALLPILNAHLTCFTNFQI